MPRAKKTDADKPEPSEQLRYCYLQRQDDSGKNKWSSRLIASATTWSAAAKLADERARDLALDPGTYRVAVKRSGSDETEYPGEPWIVEERTDEPPARAATSQPNFREIIELLGVMRMNEPPARGSQIDALDAYQNGFRAGYDQGYKIGKSEAQLESYMQRIKESEETGSGGPVAFDLGAIGDLVQRGLEVYAAMKDAKK